MSYSALPSYCYVLEQKNPGTITDIVIDHDNQFKKNLWLLVHVFLDFIHQYDMS